MAWVNETKYAKECERKGYRYDFKKADKVCRFFENLTCTYGRFAEKPFRLLTWQEEILRKVFGTVYKDTGFRVIRKVFCQIAKKNGKTEFAGALALYMLMADDENTARVYCAAADKEQATLVFESSAQMVRNDEMLSGRTGIKCTKIIDSTKRIVYFPTASYLKVLSSDVKTKHGLNVSAAIIDELHAHYDRNLFDVLTVGSGAARDQQLIFTITTAGYDKNSVCYEEYEYAKKIIKGLIKDDAYLPVIFEMGEKDDWKKEENWYKANPSLGITIKIEDMRDEFNKAMEIPARQNTFRQLRLNQWTQQANRWIDLDRWIAQGGERLNEADFLGLQCCGGCDLSSVSDMTAWVLVFEDKNDSELVYVLCRFWVPEARLTDPKNKYREAYQQWVKQGYLTVTPGDAIDYAFIKKQILEDNKKFKIDSVNFDRLFQGVQLMQELENDGLKVAEFAMGHKSFSYPMKDFEGRFLKGKIRHGNNPVLNWMADNIVVKPDVNNNLMPDKASAQGKIDGIVSLVMALDRNARKEPEYYETAYSKEEFICI